ncbi:MAG: hypothetical protein U0930_06310 [Pirellulales bacterium]
MHAALPCEWLTRAVARVMDEGSNLFEFTTDRIKQDIGAVDLLHSSAVERANKVAELVPMIEAIALELAYVLELVMTAYDLKRSGALRWG